MNKILLIQDAIEKAKRHESKLSAEALMVPAFTSVKIRHLMNNLGAISENYYEIGSHKGGSLCSTMYGNLNLKTATACDNFCEFYKDGETKEEFLANAKKFASYNTQWQLLEQDCWTVKSLPAPIDFYCFDGEHSESAQHRAMTYIPDFLADEAIIVVDDFSWPDVHNGTHHGLKKSGLEILFHVKLETPDGGLHNDHWHNGTGVFLVRKPIKI